MKEERTCHVNAFFDFNGFRVKMTRDSVTNRITVQTKHIETGVEIDSDKFNCDDPADVSAAFAKCSMSITWAVTNTMHDVVTSGM